MVNLKKEEYIYFTTKRGCRVKIGNDCGVLYYEKEIRTKKNGYTRINYKLVNPTNEMLNVAKACQKERYKDMNKDYAIKIVSNWLKNYSNEVVVRVMKNYDTIINDKTTFNMLSKLYNEENKEEETFIHDIEYMVKYGIKDETKDMLRLGEYSQSYREVLYDLYIR